MRKVPAPMKSRMKKMTRLQLVIGNWLLDSAEERGVVYADPAHAFREAITLSDQLKRFFRMEEK